MRYRGSTLKYCMLIQAILKSARKIQRLPEYFGDENTHPFTKSLKHV